MAINTHFTSIYRSRIKQLKSQVDNRPPLIAMVHQEEGEGEFDFCDAMGPSANIDSDPIDNDVHQQLATDTYEIEDFDGLASNAQTGGELRKMMVPNIGETSLRAVAKPRLQRWGRWLPYTTDMLTVMDIKSNVYKQGFKYVNNLKHRLVFDALKSTGSQYQSGGSQGDINTVAHTNVLTTDSASQLAAGERIFNVDVCEEITQTLMDLGIDTGNGDVFAMISPKQWREIRKANRKEILNSDFVGYHQYLVSGKLPEVSGIKLVVHNWMSHADHNNKVYVWQKDCLTFKKFSGANTSFINQEDVYEGRWQMYMREHNDVVVNDPLGKLRVTIGAGV